jgi:chromosome partitioning protein
VAKKVVETDTRFAIPKKLSSHGPARIIAMCNQKGGVGKTTTAVNMAAALAEYGRKVLVVDFDPQGALSTHLGVIAVPGEIATIYDLMKGTIKDPHEVIRPSPVKNLDLIPANIDLSVAEIELVNEVARESILANILRKVSDEYDVIIIDCQPSLGLLNVNALTAAHGVLIPMATDFFALRGVALLKDQINKVQDRLNPAIKLDGILVTLHERTLHSKEVLDRLHEAFGNFVFKTQISRAVKFKDATVAQLPITAYAPNSEAAESYRSVARELISRGCAP